MSPIIVLENLQYAYPPPAPGEARVQVLRGLDLTIEAGSFVGLMGRTGAGKSTLCLSLLGIVPQSTGGVIGGRVLVAGMDTRREPVAALAQRVGLVFQDPETQFLQLTVEDEVAFGPENLGLPPAEIEARVTRSLAFVGIEDLRRRAPHHLSGGQKQRAAIAAALAMEPEVLVFDEPTASLDPLGKREVMAVVERLRRERQLTVLLVEQDSELVAEYADRVLVLDDGRLALDGSPEQVFGQPVEELAPLGVDPPSVTEIGRCLNQRLGTDHRFTRFEPAADALATGLREGG